MEVKDIKIIDGMPAITTNGDFAIAESTLQHQELLLVSVPGEWKQNPRRGVGISGYIEDSDSSALARKILSEFSEDGMRVNKIDIEYPNINIDAEY